MCPIRRDPFAWGAFLFFKDDDGSKPYGKNQWRLAVLRYSRGEMPLRRLKVRVSAAPTRPEKAELN